MMTDVEHDALTRALTQKVLIMCGSPSPDVEALRAAVSIAVADTALYCEGVFRLNADGNIEVAR